METNGTRPFIRILYVNHFPLVSNFCPHFPPLHITRFCQWPGMMVEASILNVLTKELNLQIIPMTATNLLGDDELVEYADRSLLDGTVDLIAKPSQKTPHRLEKYDFSERIYYTHTRVLKRLRTNNYDQFWSFFQTYDTYVWFSIFAAWIFQWLACVIVRHVEAKMAGGRTPSIGESAWQLLRLQLHQPEPMPHVSKAGKFSLFFFSLLQCAIVGVFGSFILGNIIHVRRPTASSMQSVIQHLTQKEYQLVTSSEKFIHELLNSSNAYPYRQIAAALERNPLSVVKTPEQAIEAVTNGKAMIFQLADDSSVLMTSKYCDLTTMDDEMPILESFLTFRKNSSWTPLFNRAIKANEAKIKRIYLKYIEYMSAKRNCSKSQKHEPLHVNPYAGLVFICAAIVGLAVVVLTAEILVWRLGRCPKRRQKPPFPTFELRV